VNRPLITGDWADVKLWLWLVCILFAGCLLVALGIWLAPAISDWVISTIGLPELRTR
jgi:hypothetical protein